MQEPASLTTILERLAKRWICDDVFWLIEQCCLPPASGKLTYATGSRNPLIFRPGGPHSRGLTASGAMHSFTSTAQFQSLATALADYATALSIGQSPTAA